MKTRELIQALQEQDPSGECEVVAGATPIYFVERQPAWYDGHLEMLVHDESKKGTSYSITGYKVTNRGNKVVLFRMGLDDVLCDDPDAPVDLSDLNDGARARWEEHVSKLREEYRE